MLKGCGPFTAYLVTDEEDMEITTVKVILILLASTHPFSTYLKVLTLAFVVPSLMTVLSFYLFPVPMLVVLDRGKRDYTESANEKIP